MPKHHTAILLVFLAVVTVIMIYIAGVTIGLSNGLDPQRAWDWPQRAANQWAQAAPSN